MERSGMEAAALFSVSRKIVSLSEPLLFNGSVVKGDLHGPFSSLRGLFLTAFRKIRCIL